MTVDDRSFGMTSTISGSYGGAVEYEFKWMRFAEMNDTEIRIGDVFQTIGLFLYGEGTVNVAFPSG